MIFRLLLTVCRFSLTAWVGAAALFVVTAVLEQRSPELDSTVKAHLALLRFPAYYIFGAGLLITALLSGVVASWRPPIPRGRLRLTLILTAVAISGMAVDYVFIYRPLAEMLTPAESVRTQSFRTYHQASEWINTFHAGCAILASILAIWPNRFRES